MFEGQKENTIHKSLMLKDYKQMEKLGEWKELFESLVDISRDLMFILNENGEIIFVNIFGASELEYHQDELIGKHLLDIIEPSNQLLVNSSISLAIKNEYTLFESFIVDKYENTHKYQFSIRAVKKNDKIIGLLGIAKNVTYLRKLENELNNLKPKLTEANRLITLERTRSISQKMMLEELNSMKSEFVSNISHELRTPIASIVGFSETIASDPNMPEEMKQEFNLIILNEGKRLAKLINDVLDISRMESGRLILNKSKVNLARLLKEVITHEKGSAEEKGLIITLETPPEEIIAEIDEERFSQALQALMKNAIKFSSKKGRIKVILNNLYREVEIIISDTGVGIPEKDLPYLFQKFYRVNRPDSDLPGAGMGLVFVKQIVDLHKGLINIQSEPNKGTTILIKLLKNYKD
ncbi:MAG: ATP-binding protein [Ignavibacteriaceae bacterium]|jgi:PAS domain S-box-containing protein|nr:ATP-binding protein [Ignavibacteriaceae bacterium]